MTPAEAETWMRRALVLAERGRGAVEPNPLVGALVVREGRVVGEGWHERFGKPADPADTGFGHSAVQVGAIRPEAPQVLLDYYVDSKGDPRDVVQKIRPVVETYCKILGGDLFADIDALGVMVGKIRNAGGGHQLAPLADDLDDLNEYTKRYHHGENTNAATEKIDDTELQGKVRLTLELTGGC